MCCFTIIFVVSWSTVYGFYFSHASEYAISENLNEFRFIVKSSLSFCCSRKDKPSHQFFPLFCSAYLSFFMQVCSNSSYKTTICTNAKRWIPWPTKCGCIWLLQFCWLRLVIFFWQFLWGRVLGQVIDWRN